MEKYISVKEIEDAAVALLPKTIRDYYTSGATDETTLVENRSAFGRQVPTYYKLLESKWLGWTSFRMLIYNFRLRIRPKSLAGVTGCDLNTKILGDDVAFPVGVAPSAMQRMAHPDGELASVRGNNWNIEELNFLRLLENCVVKKKTIFLFKCL